MAKKRKGAKSTILKLSRSKRIAKERWVVDEKVVKQLFEIQITGEKFKLRVHRETNSTEIRHLNSSNIIMKKALSFLFITITVAIKWFIGKLF